MQIDVRSNAHDIIGWLDGVRRDQVPYITALTMTRTAKDVQMAELRSMRAVFDRPTPYALNALKVSPASKRSLIASVEFREAGGGGTPAKRFLNPEVAGGGRSRKSSEVRLAHLMGGAGYLVPAQGAPLNAYGNLSGSFFRRVLSQLGSQDQGFSAASGSARSRRNRRASAFFIPKKGGAIYQRSGKSVKPVLIISRPPNYRPRFPFYLVAQAVVAERLRPNFVRAFDEAMASANVKSTPSSVGISTQYWNWRGSASKANLFGN